MVPGKDSAIYQDRQQKLILSMQKSDLDGVALNAGPSLTYLTGLHFHLSERPVVAIFSPGNPAVLVLPELEAGKLDDIPFPVQEFIYGEKPESWGAVFNKALLAADLPGKKLGVEPRRMRFLELGFLDAGEQNIDLVSGEACLEGIRIRKDEGEIEAMQTAVNIAQDAVRAVIPLIKPGITERELAAELTIQLLRHGSDSQLPFSPIIASGPNSANPHAFPGDRRLQIGDMLIIDWGANVGGYYSDLTRTFCLGEIENKMSSIGQTVMAANQAAREIAAPGIAAQELDRAARQVIRKAGYDKYFIHRTGHGLGLESHEPPYIREGNRGSMEPGMTFTIEPGIYIPGRGGVRIEDDVVMTGEGLRSFSDLPREVMLLDY